MAIRYDNKIQNEIKRVVRNYNAKITRLEKSLTYNNVIPERIQVSDITGNNLKKAMFTNRKDLKRYLEDLGEFTKRGAEKPISQDTNIPTYLYNQIKRKQRRAKPTLTRQIHIYERENVTIGGKKQVDTIATWQNMEYKNLLAKMEKRINTDLSKLNTQELLDLNEKLTTLTKTGRNKEFQKNFIDILMKDGSTYGQDQRRILEIKRKLNQLNSTQFYHLSITEDTIRNILAYYKKIGDEDFRDYKNLNQNEIDTNFEELYNNIDNILDNYNV